MSLSVLVVGGAGYIGSHMVKALFCAGHRVTSLDSLELGHRNAVLHGELIEGDLLKPTSLATVLRHDHFDVVMHFAGYTSVGESVCEPRKYWRNNVVGTLNLLDEMLKVGMRRIVFSSSCAIYGVVDGPINEKHPQQPVHPYGFTKLAVEQALAHYACAYGLDSIALRYFNAAGADREGQLRERHDPELHLIPRVIAEARRVMGGGDATATKLSVYGMNQPTPDGTCVRDYVHVEDLCSAHLLAAERLAVNEGLGAEAYNLGTEQGHSVKAVIEAVGRVAGVTIPYSPGSARPGDPPSLVASAAKSRRVLGWQPRFTELDTIVRTAWEAETGTR